MNFEFHPAAAAEFLESVGFYESRVQGLGAAFIAEFETAIDLICEAPQLRPIEYLPDIRRGLLQRFPFGVVYRIKQSTIQILAVAHDKRRPQYWLGRL